MRIHPFQKQVESKDNGPGIGNDVEKKIDKLKNKQGKW